MANFMGQLDWAQIKYICVLFLWRTLIQHLYIFFHSNPFYVYGCPIFLKKNIYHNTNNNIIQAQNKQNPENKNTQEKLQ